MRTLDQVIFGSFPWTGTDLLQMAWLCGVAVRGRAQDGKGVWTDQLRRTSATQFRATAVDN